MFQLLLACATRRKMRAEDQSLSVPKRDQPMRDSDATMALINAIEKSEEPAVNRWHGFHPYCRLKKELSLKMVAHGWPGGTKWGACEPRRRCTGLWQLLCGFFRRIPIVHTYNTGK